MRNYLIVAMFAASLADAAIGSYEEHRSLDLDATGIDALQVEAGAGSLEISGVAGLDEIVVKATIRVPTSDVDKARERIKLGLTLNLEEQGEVATLVALFDDSGWGRGTAPTVNLQVQVPARLSLEIRDGSGAVVVRNIDGDIEIEDGSGAIDVSAIGGDVSIEDNSGSILVLDAASDVEIRDGSGSITVRGVGGSVVVDDGSGSIDVSEVAEDLIIEGDGSGSLDYSGIAGQVDTGS